MAAALGVGLVPGEVAISLGTSGTVYTVSATPTADKSGAVSGFADATGRFLPLVCTLNATQVTESIGRVLGAEANELDELALSARPGSGGVVVLPYFNGERTPNRPDATGVVAGVSGEVTRAQFARAAYEGVVCGLLDGLDALRRATGAKGAARTVLVGGGARSPAYRRIVADLSGLPITIPEGKSTWPRARASKRPRCCTNALPRTSPQPGDSERARSSNPIRGSIEPRCELGTRASVTRHDDRRQPGHRRHRPW